MRSWSISPQHALSYILVSSMIFYPFSLRYPFSVGRHVCLDENYNPKSPFHTPMSSKVETMYSRHRHRYFNTNCFMIRYGPREEERNKNDSSNDNASLLLEQQTGTLRQLVREIVEAKPPQSLPSIVTKYLDVLLSIKSDNGVKALNIIVEEASSSSERLEVEFACDYILSFMEAFVEEARSMDDKNKNLLGRIIRAIAPTSSDASFSSARYREEQLDKVLEEENENFTPSFLRHVENECRRLAASPAITKDSARLLETLQLVHLRIMEELGKVCLHNIHCYFSFLSCFSAKKFHTACSDT